MKRFAISLPGASVHQAAITEKVLDSLHPSLKINMKASPPHAGLIFLNWTSTGIVVPNQTTKLLYSFPHDYNYIPGAFAGFTFDNGSTQVAGTLPFSVGALGLIILDSDPKNVNLKYYSTDISNVTSVPAFNMQVRFYVTAERGINQ